MNLCLFCEKQHKNHNNISYADIMPSNDKIKENMNKLKESIDIFNKNIEEIINKLKKVKENMEIYFKINNNIINI